MLKTLSDYEETQCIEEAAIGTSTIKVYLKALSEFCGSLVSVTSNHRTHHGRHLYKVVISLNNSNSLPTIIIDAGQEAGTDSVTFALYIIEQLVACHENKNMITKVKWVILPSTNPDGMEFVNYFYQPRWRKNYQQSNDNLTVGVDLTRNLDSHWNDCPRITNGFSPVFPGDRPFSESETIFLRDVISKHKSLAKIYLSLKRNGHSIGYPFAYTESKPPKIDTLIRVAGEVAAKVNQRAGNIQLFLNNSIYQLEGKPHCGHSVDYATQEGIPLSFEMRVFLGSDSQLMSKFHNMPQGFEASLRTGYFYGIRELYNVLTNEKKYGKISL